MVEVVVAAEMMMGWIVDNVRMDLTDDDVNIHPLATGTIIELTTTTKTTTTPRMRPRCNVDVVAVGGGDILFCFLLVSLFLGM